MTLRRHTAVLALALLVAAVPVVPVVAAPPALPEAAYHPDLPAVDRTPPGRERAAARSADRLALGSVDRLPAAAAVGGSLYVDGCTGTLGNAFDLRRTSMAMKDDGSLVQLTLRVCLDGPALDTFAGQELRWQLTSTRAPVREDTIVVTREGGALQVHVDGVPANDAVTDIHQPIDGVHELIVNVPTSRLGSLDDCNADVAVGCVTVGLLSLDSGDAVRDRMPDEGAPAPVWPSSCRPDIDPASAGRVRLTTTSPAAARTVAAALADAGYRAEAYDDAPHVDVPVGAGAEVRAALLARGDVVAVEPVAPRRTTAVEPDGEPRWDDQWYLRRIGMPDAWEATTGSGLGIAIVDNGVASDRPDLDGRVRRGFDALTGATLPSGTHSDLGGHGTAVAGLAAASGSNGEGMVGVDWTATIHPVRVFDHEGCFVTEPAYLDALEWVAAEARAGRIRVANFSLGGSAIPGEAEAIRAIVDAGAVVVAAMGNGSDTVGALPSYPAALPEVVAVGATGPSDLLAGYSNRGRHVDVVAPGGDQTGTVNGDLLTLADPVVQQPPYAPLAGTSFSTPLVAGLAALYLGEHPGATPADVARALVTTARDLGDELAGFDIAYGFGLVDAADVLAHEPGQRQVRWSGPDRYATAAEASRRAFTDPSLVDVVLLATGENYPDALAGGPLAAREHAPVLLTPRDGLHEATVAELRRLSPDRVVLLGGPTALSETVAAQVVGLGIQVERAAGEDRYATAATVALGVPGGAWRSWNASDVVYLATGENFPDALPGGAAAAANDAPLLLTARSQLPEATAEALRALRPTQVVVLGGPTAVDDAVVTQVEALGITVHRAAGQSRYETAIAALCPTSQLCHVDTRFAVVATGEGFADALGGSAVAAALRAPLVLVPRTGPVPEVVADALEIIAAEQMVVLGGPLPIPEEMADRVAQLAVP